MYFLKTATILCMITIPTVFCVNICGLEHVKPCDAANSSCTTDVLEPAVREWFRCGRPEYFLFDPLDPMKIPTLTVQFNGYVLELKNVVVTGFGDAVMTDFAFKLEENILTGSFKLNFSITSEKYNLTDPEGNLSEHCEPFCAKFKNIKSSLVWDILIVTRCDGTRYLTLRKATVTTPSVPRCFVKVDKYPALCEEDRAHLEQALVRVLGNVALQALTKGYNGLSTQAPVTEIFTLPDDKPKKC